MTDSHSISVAAGGSFVFHFLGCVVAVILLAGKGFVDSHVPEAAPFSPPPPADERTMLTPDMIIVETKPVAETDREFQRDDYVDARGMREVAEAAPGARLEADRNTAAGSDSEEVPNSGGSPDLPFQKGENIASVHIVVSAPHASAPLVGNGDLVVSNPAAADGQTGTASEEVVRNAMSGAAPKREEVSVAAVETPRARYQTAVNQALTVSKNRVVERLSLPVGSATVRFLVDQEGRKSDARFVGNPTDPRIGSAALSAVLEAELPPIPAALYEELADGQLPFILEFISYE